jgi:hypothetical protein
MHAVCTAKQPADDSNQKCCVVPQRACDCTPATVSSRGLSDWGITWLPSKGRANLPQHTYHIDNSNNAAEGGLSLYQLSAVQHKKAACANWQTSYDSRVQDQPQGVPGGCKTAFVSAAMLRPLAAATQVTTCMLIGWQSDVLCHCCQL